jgi:hypothetical protein
MDTQDKSNHSIHPTDQGKALLTDPTTVRTSSEKALRIWQQARRDVELAGRLYADQHTTATKKALRAAQDREIQALRNYTQSCYAKHAAVLNGTVRPRS